MTKIFIRKVHEDSGWRISFGDKDDVKDLLKIKRIQKQQMHTNKHLSMHYKLNK